MTEKKKYDASIYKDLQILSDSSFPKKCSSCDRTYNSVNEYIISTESIRNHSGLKESEDDDEKTIVELFRNCVCGSTLMDVFNNRRNVSAAGIARRKKFGELMERISKTGIPLDTVRKELLKIMRGEKSTIIQVKTK